MNTTPAPLPPRMIDQIEAGLALAAIAAPDLEFDRDRAGEMLAAARAAVADGILGYTLITADRPAG